MGHGDRHLTRLCTIKDMMFCYYGLWGWGLLAQSWVKCLSPRPFYFVAAEGVEPSAENKVASVFITCHCRFSQDATIPAN